MSVTEFALFLSLTKVLTLTKALEEKNDAFEMWCLRKMGGIRYKDRVTNEEVLKRLNIERNLLLTIKQTKRKYFGHLER